MNSRVALLVLLAGCAATPLYYPTLEEHVISLAKGDLEASGIAFITPSTVTGQEQEKQAVALTFTDVLKRERPALRVLTLAETLSAVNKEGLADTYVTEEPLMLRKVLERSAAELIARLP